MLPTKTPCRFPANGVTSSEVFLFQGTDRRSAKKRRVRSQVKRKLLREVSAYSTVFPEQARGYELNCYLSCPMRSRLKLAFGSMPRVFRKAYFLPLSPRLIASSLSIACASTSVRCLRTPGCSGRYAAYLSQFNPLAGFAFLPLPVGRFLFSCPGAHKNRCATLGKIGHRTTVLILL
jgi:hypothetical protein